MNNLEENEKVNNQTENQDYINMENQPPFFKQEAIQIYDDFITQINKLSKEDFIKNFNSIKLKLRDFYKYLHIYKNSKNIENDVLKIQEFQETILLKIKEFKLPYSYEILIEQPELIADSESFRPSIIKNNLGQEKMVTLLNGEIVQADISLQEKISEWIGYEAIYAKNSSGANASAVKKYFHEKFSPDSFNIKQRDIESFKEYLSMDNQSLIKELFNVKKIEDRNVFSIDDQLSMKLGFINYLHYCDKEHYEKLRTFAQQYQKPGLKTFLALEYDNKNIGDKIIEIGNRLEPAIAQKIFDKYAEIIDSVNTITDIAQNNFTSSVSLHEQSLTDIETTLHKRGVILLEKFHNQLDADPNEIIAELDHINADTLTTLAIFKHVVKIGLKLPIEAISGSEFSEKNGDQCSPTEINEMETIYQNNWKHFENQELIQTVIKKFSNSFIGTEAKKQQIYTYKKDGTISAFVKFESLEPGVKYASALNVDEHVQGFGLGEAMMDEALYREAQHNILHAMCESDKDSAMRYFEKGFISTGYSPDHPPFLQICWNEKENMKIKSKQMTTEQLAIMYLKQDTGDILIKKSKTLSELHTEFPDGLCLTRCFRDPVGTGDWYGAYETILDTYQSTTKTA